MLYRTWWLKKFMLCSVTKKTPNKTKRTLKKTHLGGPPKTPKLSEGIVTKNLKLLKTLFEELLN